MGCQRYQSPQVLWSTSNGVSFLFFDLLLHDSWKIKFLFFLFFIVCKSPLYPTVSDFTTVILNIEDGIARVRWWWDHGKSFQMFSENVYISQNGDSLFVEQKNHFKFKQHWALKNFRFNFGEKGICKKGQPYHTNARGEHEVGFDLYFIQWAQRRNQYSGIALLDTFTCFCMHETDAICLVYRDEVAAVRDRVCGSGLLMCGL